jgi:Protein of unknown function (DUF3108)
MNLAVVHGARPRRWPAAAAGWFVSLTAAVAALAVVALGTSACSGGAGKGASSPTGATPALAPAAGSPAAGPPALGGKPPLATPGERFTYKISIQGVELAEFLIDIGSDADGMVVRSVARSSGVGALLKKVETQFISHIDPQTGKPRRFRSEERAGSKDATIERSDARIAERQGDVVSVLVRRGDDAAAAEQNEQQKVQGEVWDLNAVMIALRQFEAPQGTKLAFESFRSRYVWRTELTVGKREQLTTQLGRVSTLRFEGWGHGLRRNGELNDEPERRFQIWVSDDADRVPVLLVGVTDYGDIRMEITSYTPPGDSAGSPE